MRVTGIISNMKLLALSAALMGCVPVSAQDQPKRVPETRYNFAMFRTTEGYRINAFDDRVLVTFTSYEGGCTGRSYSIRPTCSSGRHGRSFRSAAIDGKRQSHHR
jgi:hypothetical protein